MLPRFRPGAFWVFALAFIFTMLLGDQPWAATLRLTPAGVLGGDGVWQPLTASFTFPEGAMASLAGTLVIQWFLGSPVEGFWGTRRYLVALLVASLVGYGAAIGIAAAVPDVASTVLGGTVPMDLAAVTAFGFVYGKQAYSPMGMAPMPGRVVALGVGAIVLGLTFTGGSWLAAVPGAVAVLVSALFATQPWRRRTKSGTLRGREPHLRLVRTPEDLLN